MNNPDKPSPSLPAKPHLRWLFELTAIPTAAGHEHGVIEWIERWVGERASLELKRDDAGNLVIQRFDAPDDRPPLFITAHLDHPAFVVERIVGPQTISASFRGGVLDPYFKDAPVVVYASSGQQIRGVVSEKRPGDPFPECLIEIDEEADGVELGDIARWVLPEPYIEDGIFHAPACDDLAALAASLAMMDRLLDDAGASHVKLLFTRAEEVGFVGAIAACKLGTMPKGSQVIALENSRSFEHDSPIGAGPIVRVGDRLSTFSPRLTSMVAKAAAKLAGEIDRPAGTPSASGDPSKQTEPKYQWQRKLMAGGACEATAFCAYGYEATCICLPLGNYHNMANLAGVQSGDEEAIAGAKLGSEYISVNDYEGMIDMLVECGKNLEASTVVIEKLEKLHRERAFVLKSDTARS